MKSKAAKGKKEVKNVKAVERKGMKSEKKDGKKAEAKGNMGKGKY